MLLVNALRRLPFMQRRALALHYLCDLSLEQIAAETRTSVGTVKCGWSTSSPAGVRYVDGWRWLDWVLHGAPAGMGTAAT